MVDVERRLIVLNSYSMRDALALIERGEYPDHHLWGGGDLPRDAELRVGGHTLASVFRRAPWLPTRLSSAIEIAVGDPLQQFWALTQIKGESVILAGTQRVPVLLALLRRARLLNTRLIVVVHDSAHRWWTRCWLRGVSEVWVFSGGVEARLVRQGVPASRIHVINWGPALNARIYRGANSPDVDLDFVAAGKDNRDYCQLERSALRFKLSGMIFDGRSVRQFKDGRCTVLREGRVPYPDVIKAMKRSAVVVIPIRNAAKVTGLTELADAIALGKPVIVTKNDVFPFDPSRVGVGAWLDVSSDSALAGQIRAEGQRPDRNFDEVRGWYSVGHVDENIARVLGATDRGAETAD